MESHDHDHCRYLLGSLSDYVDGELGDTLCAELERHMADCENCRVVIDTLRKTVSLYHVTSTRPEMPTEVRERLFKRLDLEDFFVE
jgi:anti-sigma factor RsiW